MKKSWRVENKYSRWYDALIEKARNRSLEKPYERHHVHPKCLGGDKKSETVNLTYREHFLAHWLLTRFARGTGRYRVASAFARMCNGRPYFTSWQYVIARKVAHRAHSDFMLQWWDGLSDKERKRRLHIVAETQRKQRLDPNYVKAQAEAASRTMKSNWEEPEFREKVLRGTKKANTEKWDGPRFRAKHSKRLAQVAKDSWQDPDIRQKTIKSMKQTWNTPENKEVQRQKTKTQWGDPAFRKMMKDTTPARVAGCIKSNQERVWTPEMTAKRVEKFKAFYDAKRGGPKPPKPGKAKGERSGMSKIDGCHRSRNSCIGRQDETSIDCGEIRD